MTDLEILSKALRPLPDKWHGVNDAETRYRQREVDLLANQDSRRVFDIRFKTLAILRHRLDGARTSSRSRPRSSSRRPAGPSPGRS